jgi:Fe-S cluster biogenesis protein NfuA/nitrite reductase/ring-hydroxylating ferredoxin subunit
VDDDEVRGRVAELDGLLGQLESVEGPARELALEAVSCLLELYGAGLARVLAAVDAGGAPAEIRARFVDDELVSHLLLLHELHPEGVEVRVARALDEVRPYLQSHGGDVELVGVEGDVARLRLRGSCDGCPSSAMTLRLAVEEAIHAAAPELARIEADGAVEAPRPRIPLTVLSGSPGPPAPSGAWAVAGGLPQLSGGGTLVRELEGERVLFVRLVDGSYHAHRPDCPGCGAGLGGAALQGSELTCPDCGLRYDVRRAGRSLDRPDVYLEPYPLLVSEAGLVKVALGSGAA